MPRSHQSLNMTLFSETRFKIVFFIKAAYWKYIYILYLPSVMFIAQVLVGPSNHV